MFFDFFSVFFFPSNYSKNEPAVSFGILSLKDRKETAF